MKIFLKGSNCVVLDFFCFTVWTSVFLLHIFWQKGHFQLLQHCKWPVAVTFKQDQALSLSIAFCHIFMVFISILSLFHTSVEDCVPTVYWRHATYNSAQHLIDSRHQARFFKPHSCPHAISICDKILRLIANSVFTRDKTTIILRGSS